MNPLLKQSDEGGREGRARPSDRVLVASLPEPVPVSAQPGDARSREAEKRRRRYYQSRGLAEPPLPRRYRTALKGGLRRYFAIEDAGKLKCVRILVVDILNEAEPLDRACYMLLELYKSPLEEIARELSIAADEVSARADKMRTRVDAVALKHYQFKDWPLIQSLIDEGVTEREVKEMLGITQAGWDLAKRRGSVHV